MSNLALFPRQEIPSLLTIVEEPTRHIRVLWGIEKLPFSYANRTALDAHIIAFSRDIVLGDTPPAIAISNDLCYLEYRPVPSQYTAASKVTKLRPEEHSIPEAASVA